MLIRRGLAVLALLASACIVGADTAHSAGPIACTEVALRDAVAAGGVIELAGPCTVQLGSQLVIGAGASAPTCPAPPTSRRCARARR